jgi:RNA polymerase sigma-70 factor (ECF subfamily)
MHSCSSTHSPAPRVFQANRLSSGADDQELLLRSAAGHGEAFQSLFARHRDGLQGFLFRKLHSHEEAEDALVLTFCNAWRARESFRGDASGKAWLYQIATRVALDLLRRHRRHPEQELDARPELARASDPELPDPVALVLERDRDASTRHALGQAISRLPREEAALLRLFYFDGRSYDEISALLGVSRSRIRGRLHRIRMRVRKDLVERQRWQPA